MSWHPEHLLSDFLNGELSDSEQERVEKHLEVCSRCRSDLELFREVDRLAQEAPQLEPSEQLWDRIAARVQSAAWGRPPAAIADTKAFPVVLRPRWMAMAAVVLMFLLAALFVARQPSRAELVAELYQVNVPVAKGNPFLPEPPLSPSRGNPFFTNILTLTESGANPFSQRAETR